MTVFKPILTHSKLFSEVESDLYCPILEGCTVQELRTGEVVITPGVINRHIHLVLSGALTIHLGQQESPPVGQVGIGEIVGELSLIGHTVTSAWVVCAADSRLLVIDESRLWRLIDQSPLVARNLLQILTGWILAVDGHVLEQRKQIEMLQSLARIDALTGLFNRRWFDESLARMLALQHVAHPVTLILVDIDHFKKFNDTYGHPGGDQALRFLAKVLKSAVRLHDVAARYGGEEFALILPGTPLTSAVHVAERLRQAAMERPVETDDGQPLGAITISLGVAESIPHMTPEFLTRAADDKLYQAKREGRNRVCY
ncbi:MAG: GGDEF domain-containing protein [Magnetococcales bacterium]|nr:GGDEF domain-containing protein [Magnetococcales bacterium]